MTNSLHHRARDHLVAAGRDYRHFAGDGAAEVDRPTDSMVAKLV